MKLYTGMRSIFSAFIIVTLALGLQACGGGGGSTTTPVNTSLASAARGYYEGGVELNVAAGNLIVSSPNFKAIVDEKQFVIIFKGSQILLYKGTFTEVTTTTFKADLRVYRAGNFIATATIANGTIDAGVSLKGTITGTGAYVSDDYASSAIDVDLTYNNANSLTPPVYTANSWQDAAPTGNVTFHTTTNIDFYPSVDNVPTELSCDALDFNTTNVVNEQTGRIRTFLTSALSGCSTTTIEGNQLNGYFTNYNGGGTDDDRMLIVVSDDNYAYIGILSCLNGTGACF